MICIRGMLAIALALGTATQATANSRDQAQRLHNRLAGVPADAATLDSMAALIDGNQAAQAAEMAMDDPAFYNVTLKLFATPWTNEEQDVFAPLNDYTATVIGAIRDDVDFRRILSDDLLYVGNGSSGAPAPSASSNAHYQALEDNHADLKSVLVARSQVSTYGTPAEAVSGVLTTRAAARAFFYAGTNRAMIRFTLINHLCRDLEQVKDTTRPSDRIRQDVSRSPGGDSRIFRNSCIGCHSGMDPLAQAFAYYDWQGDQDGNGGRMVYNTGVDADTGTRVQGKYLINSTNFPAGYITLDNHWDNYWRTGPNANLGWDSSLPGSGDSAADLGRELSHSDAFASCQAQKVFRAVCLRKPADSADSNELTQMTSHFRNDNYRMKTLFADAAVYCMGD